MTLGSRALGQELRRLVDIVAPPLNSVRVPTDEYDQAVKELRVLLSNPDHWRATTVVKPGAETSYVRWALGKKRLAWLASFYAEEVKRTDANR